MRFVPAVRDRGADLRVAGLWPIVTTPFSSAKSTAGSRHNAGG
jgi:hypothetical protein